MTPIPPPVSDMFVDAWAVYRLIVEHDYLWHAAGGAALRNLVTDRFPSDSPIRFLDLACGDADTTSKALAGRHLGRYVGVDRSPDALKAATVRVADLGCPAEFVTGDFLDFLEATPDRFDVIYVGLSAHHLNDRLGRFFTAVRHRLSPGGMFAVYEPFLLPDETRADHINRLCEIVEKFFTEMTPAQRRQVADHVRGNDYPVRLDRWNELATAAGLSPARRVYRSPDRLYELVAHET
jgi:SAM-dependent methyltransferase